jgi:hypothetical protein
MTRTALALIAAAGLCMTATHYAHASTLNFADYPTFASSNTQGTLDGVVFTLSFQDQQGAGNTTINLSTSTFDSAGSASEEAATYSNGSFFSIIFDQEIYDFALYLNQFRSANQGGSNQYSFTGVAGFGRDDFNLNDAFVGATKSGNAINLTESFASGILRFSDPVTVLTVFSSSLQGFPQSFTFSGNAQPVPEPTSIAFLATGGRAVGVVAVVRRRRRMHCSAGCRR